MMRQFLVRFGFRYPEAAKERLFVERFVLIHLRTTQVFLLATGVLFCLFFLWDRAVDPAHWRNVLVLRELILAPVIFGAAALLFVPRLQPFLETIVSLALAITLGGFAAICARLDHGFRFGAAGMLLIFFGGTSMFPLRVSFLILPSAVTIAGFLGLEALLHRITSDLMIVNGLVTLTAVLIAALATAGRELAARREFLTDLALDAARTRVDDLLHSIMPREIAERIQGGETTIADIHDEVSILFADLVGFTAMSRQMSASQLVDMLNTVFSRFDAAADRLGVEKIKTIGDAYMAVGGLSSGEASRAHAERMADFALAMREITAEISAETGLPVDVKIGLHIGPVVAGVIGVKKPAFDCWGEAVNMASRLESSSGPGAILISEAAFDRLWLRFRVEAATPVNLKGIGKAKVYRLYERLSTATAA
jgi:class 3 adenylate cyclase